MPHRPGFFFNRVAGLPLGADKQHIFTGRDNILKQALGPQQSLNGFLHIDDVNHVALAMDVGLHAGVPTADAVAEVDAGVHEVFNELGL